MRLCDIFDRLDGNKYPSLARLDNTIEFPTDVLHAITRCMAVSAVPRFAPVDVPPPPPIQMPFGASAAASTPAAAQPSPYNPFTGSSLPSPPKLMVPPPHVPLAAPPLPQPSVETTVEAGCVLALEGHDNIVTGDIKTGKSHSINLSPGEAPLGTFYFGTLHSHPIDERSGTGTPHSDADFAVFQKNEHCMVEIVATGIFKPLRVSEVYLLIRTRETDIDMDLRFYDRGYRVRLEFLMAKNQRQSLEERELVERWAMGEAARFATWAMAKKYKFGFYEGKGEGGVSRTDDKTDAIFPIEFPR